MSVPGLGRPQPARLDRVADAVVAVDHALAHADAVQRRHVEPALERGQRVGRQRFAGADGVPPAGQVEGADGVAERREQAIDRRRSGEVADAVLLDQRQPAPRAERPALAVVQHDGEPLGQGVEEGAGDRQQPAQLGRTGDHVVGAIIVPPAHQPIVGDGVAMQVNDALGVAGGAGSVGDEGRVVVPRDGRRERLAALIDQALKGEHVGGGVPVLVLHDDHVLQGGTVRPDALDGLDKAQRGNGGDGLGVLEAVTDLGFAELRAGGDEDAPSLAIPRAAT